MQVFEMAQTGQRGVWIVLFLILTVMTIVAALIFIGSRPPKFEVTAEGLQIRGGLFGRTIPASQLRLDEAKIVDLSASEELRPRWRTMGIGLPGYQAGWFRLRNKEKALVFLNRNRALYVPTTAGYSLLISPADPDALLGAMRAGRH